MIAHPYLLAVPIAIAVAFIVAALLGVPRRGQLEALAGLRALRELDWQDYAHLVEDLLRERGYTRPEAERSPGEGGFDLFMERGSSRYLIECKNSAADRVSAAVVTNLSMLIDRWHADGAVIASTQTVEPAADALALNRRIEILAGDELWRQIKPWVPHETRVDAEAFEVRARRRRIAVALVCGIAAGVLFAMFAPLPERPIPAPATTPAAAVVAGEPAVPASAPAPAVEAPVTAVRLPPQQLEEAELERRRGTAAMEVRGIPAVQSALWSTRSTLVVVLHTPGAPITDSLFEEACRVLLQFEELRFTRMQIESPPLETGGASAVRWRSCQ
jgi:restriction system protein